MSNTIKLSQRLKEISSFLPLNTNFADIGSDHAYLPCYVCLNNPKATAIAGEINEGPFNRAIETVTNYQLKNRVDVRLGNGLEVIEKGEVEQLVIAGMGGALIRSILEDGKEKLGNVNRMILQPNVDEAKVREWLLINGYMITNEKILEENNHIYEIIVADAISEPLNTELSKKELLFGPLLLKEKKQLFYTKWHAEKNKKMRIINQLLNAKSEQIDELHYFKQELKWIEEVLEDEQKYN